MKKILVWLLLVSASTVEAQQVSNDRFTLSLNKNGTVTWSDKTENVAAKITPEFNLFFTIENPDMRLRQVPHLAYKVPQWKRVDGKGYSWDMYKVARRVPLKVKKTSVAGQKIVWEFLPI